MNLSAFEFVVCQREKCSPIMLSEFAGASQCLSGCRRVNPWNSKDMVEAYQEILSMTFAEKKLKWQYNYKYTTKHTALFWAKTFLQELLRVPPEVSVPPLMQVWRQLKISFDKATCRLFLLDYDGTLSPIAKYPGHGSSTVTPPFAACAALPTAERECVRLRVFFDLYSGTVDADIGRSATADCRRPQSGLCHQRSRSLRARGYLPPRSPWAVPYLWRRLMT
jgi:hypothetical protein